MVVGVAGLGPMLVIMSITPFSPVLKAAIILGLLH
jgi:hypothetical protein